MVKVLISGGGGAIGFHMATALAARGDDVIIADNYSRSQRDQALEDLFAQPNVTEVRVDLCDAAAVGALPKDVDYVYHLAALNGTQNFYERPFDVLESSTVPTINLLRHYKDSSLLKRFVYAGSSETYASTVELFDWEVPTDEKVPLTIADVFNVRWSYGGSKLHGELATVAAGAQFDMPFTIIRYHNAYGPRMGDKHVVPDFLERAQRGEYVLYGFEDTRSFIYVSDTVAASIALAETPRAQGEVVNVGGADEITMLELGQKMMALLGKDDEIICHPSPKGSVKRRAPNLAKLKALTGYEPKWTLEQGLQETIRYYLDGPGKDGSAP